MQEQRSKLSNTHNKGHHSHSHSGFSESYVYAPNEISLIGCDADRLFVDRLVGALGARYRVALLEESVQAFAESRSEAWRAVEHGASPVMVSGREGYALLGSGAPDRWTAAFIYNDADIVLVENDYNPMIAKVVVVDSTGDRLDGIQGEATANVVAYVRSERLPSEVDRRLHDAAGELPIFDASAHDALAEFLLNLLTRNALSAPLYGLVLGGGQSTRMKRDKAKIEYRGVAQVRYAYELLDGLCDRTYVSIRADQAAESVFSGLEPIFDRFSGIGPMGGILSAMHTHPNAAWLVLGCDLPFVDDRTLRDLTTGRDPILQATCYESSRDGLPEPLCAIYEPRYRRRLHQFLSDGRDCPRKALINTRVKRLELHDPRALDNINNPDDFERAAARIREEAGRAG